MNLKLLSLDGPAIRNANPGDSRELIRANRFAEAYFDNVRATCANRIKSASRNFGPPKRDLQKRGSVREP